MVDNLTQFIESFRNRNLFDDDKLAELVNQANAIIHNVDTESLRQSDFLRNRISSEMSVIKNAVDASIEDLPRRRIRLVA